MFSFGSRDVQLGPTCDVTNGRVLKCFVIGIKYETGIGNANASQLLFITSIPFLNSHWLNVCLP